MIRYLYTLYSVLLLHLFIRIGNSLGVTPTYNACPSSEWISVGNQCFFIAQLSYYSIWEYAIDSCASQAGDKFNGTLASIHDKETNDWIHSYIANYGMDGLWIGLSREALDKPWHWTDGSDVNFKNWSPGEPNNKDSGRMCTEIWISNGKWNDADCYKEQPYVCSAMKAPPPPTPVLPTDGPGNCQGPEWFAFGDSGYLFYPDKYLRWSEAEYQCRKQGSEALASIKDSAENWFIWTKILEISDLPETRGSWIGLIGTNGNDKSSFEWYDGSPFNYNNWATARPFGKNQKCVAIYSDDGTWKNTDCTDKLGYVCKQKKDIITTQAPTTPNHADCLKPGGVVGVILGLICGTVIIALITYSALVYKHTGRLPSLSKLCSVKGKNYGRMDQIRESESPDFVRRSRDQDP